MHFFEWSFIISCRIANNKEKLIIVKSCEWNSGNPCKVIVFAVKREQCWGSMEQHVSAFVCVFPPAPVGKKSLRGKSMWLCVVVRRCVCCCYFIPLSFLPHYKLSERSSIQLANCFCFSFPFSLRVIETLPRFFLVLHSRVASCQQKYRYGFFCSRFSYGEKPSLHRERCCVCVCDG